MQIISELMGLKLLRTIALLMRNFIANFVRILGICKDFAGNRVNELGNVPRCGVVPKLENPGGGDHVTRVRLTPWPFWGLTIDN